MSDQVLDRIVQLIWKYKQDALTAIERAELEAWIQLAPKNKEVFQSLLNEELLLNEVTEDYLSNQRIYNAVREKIGFGPPTMPATETPVISFTRRRWRWVAAAAIFILAGGGGYYFLNTPKGSALNQAPVGIAQVKDVPPGGNRAVLTLSNGKQIILDSVPLGSLTQQGNAHIHKVEDGRLTYDLTTDPGVAVGFNTLVTPRAGQYQVVLPDGTHVWLNNASSLKYPTVFTGSQRIVELSGEAYFEVQPQYRHGKKTPFLVNILSGPGKAAGSRVEVLGTHFNIMAYADEDAVKTTLLEGSVKVVKGSNLVIIKPGDQARVDSENSGKELKVLHQVDVQKVVAWKNGYFHFDRADIKSVLRQLARWYDIEIMYQGNVPYHFDGRIQRNLTLSQICENLLAENGVKYKMYGRTLTILP